MEEAEPAPGFSLARAHPRPNLLRPIFGVRQWKGEVPGSARVVATRTIPAWCPQLFPDRTKGDGVGDARPRHPDPGEGAKYSDLEKYSWICGCPPGSKKGWRTPAPSLHPVPGQHPWDEVAGQNLTAIEF